MKPKQRLLDERRRLQEVLEAAAGGLAEGSESAASGELSSYDQHPADTGTEMFYREADQAITESVRAQLGDVERALSRIDEGTYGHCDACGQPIGAERLDALPAARFC